MNDNELEIRAQIAALAVMTSALRVLAIMSLAKVDPTREALWAAIEVVSPDNEHKRRLAITFEDLMDDADKLRSLG